MNDEIHIVSLGCAADVRSFPHGRLELYRMGDIELGRAVYEPGWRWSEHVAPTARTALCEVGHVGFVLTGKAAVRMADGTEKVLMAGDFFVIPPGHDSWVLGDQRYSSLHLTAAGAYARPADADETDDCLPGN